MEQRFSVAQPSGSVKQGGPATVRVLVAAGVPLGDAMRLALHASDLADGPTGTGAQPLDPRRSISRLAARYGLNRANTSSALHGNRALTPAMLAAVIDRLGGSSEKWVDLYWENARQVLIA